MSQDRDPKRPISKAEFVGAMLLLAMKDRELYRALRARGWEGAISGSEIPN